MPYYSPSTGGFYLKHIHGRGIPADAITITNRQHDEIMLAQRQGHEIIATPSGPVARPRVADTAAAFRQAANRVKREARKRILAIATLEQQSNDNAALALAALKGRKGDSTAIQGALERRQKIDALRDASNCIEASLAGHTDEELTAFDAAVAAWPNN